MKTAMATVNAYLDAFARKDMAALRRLLSGDFRFRGPLMSLDGVDAFITAMTQFPCEATTEGSRFVAGDDYVAHAFVWKMTKPATADIPMCEFFEVKDGKILASDLFYDSRLFLSMPGQG